MGTANERVEVLREAAGDLLEGLDRVDERSLVTYLGGMSEDAFSGLCATFRMAEVRDGVCGLVLRLSVYVAVTGILLWSISRVAAAWVLLLMVACGVLMLVSACMDVIAFLRLQRRSMVGLGMGILDVLVYGYGTGEAIRDFCNKVNGVGDANV